jgi:hypothetical protein
MRHVCDGSPRPWRHPREAAAVLPPCAVMLRPPARRGLGSPWDRPVADKAQPVPPGLAAFAIAGLSASLWVAVLDLLSLV